MVISIAIPADLLKYSSLGDVPFAFLSSTPRQPHKPSSTSNTTLSILEPFRHTKHPWFPFQNNSSLSSRCLSRFSQSSTTTTTPLRIPFLKVSYLPMQARHAAPLGHILVLYHNTHFQVVCIADRACVYLHLHLCCFDCFSTLAIVSHRFPPCLHSHIRYGYRCCLISYSFPLIRKGFLAP